MSLSNYPPGVTGLEPEIAGDEEYEDECYECGAEVTGYGAHGFFEYDCDGCGFHGEFELDPPCRCGDYCRC